MSVFLQKKQYLVVCVCSFQDIVQFKVRRKVIETPQ